MCGGMRGLELDADAMTRFARFVARAQITLKRSRLLRWGVSATFFWLLAVLFYLASVASWGEFSKPNQFGDFFAGIFAPLAFLWLVLATMLQRRELELQRKELAQNREALMLQAKELKASVEQLATQAQIMLEEQNRNQTHMREQSFETRILKWAIPLSTLLEITSHWRITIKIDESSTLSKEFLCLADRCSRRMLVSFKEGRVGDMCANLSVLFVNLIRNLEDERCVLTDASIGRGAFVNIMREHIRGLGAIVADSEWDSSPFFAVRAKALGLVELLNAMAIATGRIERHEGLKQSWPESLIG